MTTTQKWRDMPMCAMTFMSADWHLILLSFLPLLSLVIYRIGKLSVNHGIMAFLERFLTTRLLAL
jgi:hypothetical protein